MQKREPNFTVIQVAVWILVYLLMLLYTVRGQDSLFRGFVISSESFSTCLLAIYCQSHFLIPYFFQRGRKPAYFMWTAVAFLGLVSIRSILEFLLINRLLGLGHFYTLGVAHLTLSSLVVFLCSVIGILLRISLNYVDLLRNQEILRNKQLTTELHLLKNQVQPHFMFNTLNNIYSLAHRKSDKTAEVVAMLSEIMRYFVHEAGKEQVRLADEIKFIQNYIALESIRMLHPPEVHWSLHLPSDGTMLPPMLFIPFIENIFKHGITQSATRTEIFLTFQVTGSDLVFCSQNHFEPRAGQAVDGTGLANLRKRLEILYGHTHDLVITDESGIFEVRLKIPIHDTPALPDR